MKAPLHLITISYLMRHFDSAMTYSADVHITQEQRQFCRGESNSQSQAGQPLSNVAFPEGIRPSWLNSGGNFRFELTLLSSVMLCHHGESETLQKHLSLGKRLDTLQNEGSCIRGKQDNYLREHSNRNLFRGSKKRLLHFST